MKIRKIDKTNKKEDFLFLDSVDFRKWRFAKYVLGFKYFKLSLFLVCLFFAYYWFVFLGGGRFISGLKAESYPVIFLAGVLYCFGFTAPFAAGLFIYLGENVNIFLATIVAGLGSMLADYTIFKLVKISFQEEFDALKREKIIKFFSNNFGKKIPGVLKQYLMLGLAGFFIASPVPDEIGMSFLAGFTKISEKKLLIVSFILNSIGIFVLLSIRV